MLPAGHGDALVVEWGTRTEPHQLLIDAGTFHAWPGVQAELMRRDSDRYEVFVVTHVDEDHIGGAIALMDDPNLKHRIDNVWFNGYVHCKSGGNVLGPVNGEQLTERIVTGAFHWNDGFTPRASVGVGGPIVVPSTGDLRHPDLPGGGHGGPPVPHRSALKAMAKKWRHEVIEAHLVPGEGDGGTPAVTEARPRDRVIDQLPLPLDRAALAVSRPRRRPMARRPTALDRLRPRVRREARAIRRRRLRKRPDRRPPAICLARGRDPPAHRPGQAGPSRQQRQHLYGPARPHRLPAVADLHQR